MWTVLMAYLFTTDTNTWSTYHISTQFCIPDKDQFLLLHHSWLNRMIFLLQPLFLRSIFCYCNKYVVKVYYVVQFLLVYDLLDSSILRIDLLSCETLLAMGSKGNVHVNLFWKIVMCCTSYRLLLWLGNVTCLNTTAFFSFSIWKST